MGHGISTVQVKRSKGILVVQGLGKTPRGQKFIRGLVPLKVKSMSDPEFKSELAAAVEKLYAEAAAKGK